MLASVYLAQDGEVEHAGLLAGDDGTAPAISSRPATAVVAFVRVGQMADNGISPPSVPGLYPEISGVQAVGDRQLRY